MANKQTVFDYVVALTHLYGLVHKSKVVEIYNLQNPVQISESDFFLINSAVLEEEFVSIHEDYFVHEAIWHGDDFEEQLRQREGKPFYIPPKEELLKYLDDNYFEINKEYTDLLAYLKRNFFKDNFDRAEEFCEHVQGMCKANWDLTMMMEEFDTWDIEFNSERQVKEVVQLLVNVANNTRLWENNGHTPRELSSVNRPTSPARATTASGRPLGGKEPCPCGSGKRYKRCCLGK